MLRVQGPSMGSAGNGGLRMRSSAFNFFDGGLAEFRISRVSHAAAGRDFEAERTFGAEGQTIFGRFAVDDELAAARRVGGGECTCAIAFFAHHEEQPEVSLAIGEQMFGRHDHGSDDAFGVASAAAPDLCAVIPRWDKGRHGIHVGGQRDDGSAEAHEDVVAASSTGRRSISPENRVASVLR